MTDRAYIVSRTLENKIAIAENNEQNTLIVTLDVMKEILALLKEQETSNLYKCPNCGTWVSAENVVRCKDCKHSTIINDALYCDRTDEFWMRLRKQDWFCADGEKR